MLTSGVPPAPCRIKRDTPQVEPLRLTSEPIPRHTRDMFGRYCLSATLPADRERPVASRTRCLLLATHS
jgi:hypothetical protein